MLKVLYVQFPAPYLVIFGAIREIHLSVVLCHFLSCTCPIEQSYYINWIFYCYIRSLTKT